ncbi:DMT family transporter [Primorskyibacter sp. S187A]|uniref:DMT family transporter n=1 Tax=Primorskyibacter sp. S187A TaxID=3415130 RepID=UPI003C7B0799
MSANPSDTRPRAAALSMLTGMAIIGAVDNTIAPLARDIGIWQFYFIRSLMSVPLILLAAWWGLGSVWPRRLWAVALRGGVIATAMVFYFGALAVISLPQALAGLFTSPIFVLLITAMVLGQKVGPWRIGAVAFGFLGILLVIEPWGDAPSVAMLMPVVGGFLYAFGVIATRTICFGESVLSMLLALFVCQGVIGLAALGVLGAAEGDFVTRGWVWPMAPLSWAILAVQAVGAVIGVGFLFRAYSLGDASYVTVFEYSVFVFGAFFAWLFFGELVSATAAIGIALICGAGIVIALRAPAD